jgi:hypothetical protein
VYDNGYIEIDPSQCGYSTFLGAAVPVPAPSATEAADVDGPVDSVAGIGGSNTEETPQPSRRNISSRGAGSTRIQSAGASRPGR